MQADGASYDEDSIIAMLATHPLGHRRHLGDDYNKFMATSHDILRLYSPIAAIDSTVIINQ